MDLQVSALLFSPSCNHAKEKKENRIKDEKLSYSQKDVPSVQEWPCNKDKGEERSEIMKEGS